MTGKIRIGCGVWGNRDWIGSLYSLGSETDTFLSQYANTFSAVEGNSTFYGLPTRESILKWKEIVPRDFRFCFKAPRNVTHEKSLFDTDDDLTFF